MNSSEPWMTPNQVDLLFCAPAEMMSPGFDDDFVSAHPERVLMKSLTAFSVWIVIVTSSMLNAGLIADEDAKPAENSAWMYDAGLVQPFWLGDTVDGESVLFIKDPATGEAKARLLFPVQEVLNVTRAVDWRVSSGMKYEEGRDYVVQSGSHEITLPKDSRIPSFTPDQLRRPAGSQQYKLTHRDGNGEILFAAGAEYHEMQVCISYRHAREAWANAPMFDEKSLPKTIQKLQGKEPVSIVLLGDSISTGCNASGWADSSPHQPPYQDLLLEHLKHTYSPGITLTNLAVGGTSTPWGLTRIPDVVAAKPDLVILAFGMNDSSGRSAEEYKSTTLAMIKAVRETQPQAEFILVATMLGNRDWVTLKHELFPQYRTALQELTEPGIALRRYDFDLDGDAESQAGLGSDGKWCQSSERLWSSSLRAGTDYIAGAANGRDGSSSVAVGTFRCALVAR